LLEGKTPEARFTYFCDGLKDPGFAAPLLAQYPVLVRRCIAIASNWEQATRSLIARIAASEPELLSIFFADQHPGLLVSAEASGDTHRGGQSVHVLTFRSGAKLVYKPRPMAMERGYYDVVAWLNDRGFAPSMKVVRSLDKGEFGWMQFVPVAPCETETEVERFFTRMGAHIALTWILGGSDLHSENVIANGEHPVPVDLETLFHAVPVPRIFGGATQRGWIELYRSVVRTLLLPEARGLADDPEDWVDFSALGNVGGQLTPLPVARWNRAETDAMRLVYKRAEIPTGQSLPHLAGQRVRSDAYVECVVRGFVQACKLLRKSRADFLAPQGPLSAFEGKPVRRVLRDTETYGATLLASFHPRFQRDAIAYEAMLRDAMRATAAPGSPWLRALEDAEAADLLACDVPYFQSTVGAADVLGSGGRIPIRLPEDPLQGCQTQLETMSEVDIERQTWLIRTAMHDPSTGAPSPRRRRRRSATTPTGRELIATAARIGDRIGDLAITADDRCTWLVPEFVNSRRLTTTVAGADLYNGLPGIALFLAYLGKITGERRYTRTALAAIREALSLHRRPATASGSLGAFDGAGGLSYALVHLAAVTGQTDLATAASAIVRKSARRAARTGVANTPELDVISGLAGFIAAGTAVARFNQDRGLIEALRPAVDRLSRLTTSPVRRRATSTFSDSDAGVAHGRAGAGLALLRWAEATGEAQFRAAGEALLRKDFEIKEALRRDPSATNGDKDQFDHALGWCRDSLGIGMVGLGANPPLLDLLEAGWAANITDEILTRGTEGPLCPCHGSLAWLEFLSVARQRRLIQARSAEIESWRRTLLTEVVDGRWFGDSKHALESPGLMLGLAGTGHALLRVALGARVPSFLMLEAPERQPPS
jgi:type 2 lantibiotic biosynthesis protein LanM